MSIIYPDEEAFKEALKEVLEEALREELDIHSVFAWTKYLRAGVDAFWDCRYVDADRYEHSGKASDYWSLSSTYYPPVTYGELKCPADLWSVAVYSKRPYNYACFFLKLTDIPYDDQYIYWGLENDANVGTGMLSFNFYKLGGAEHFRILAGGGFGVTVLDIDECLPANAKTARQRYAIIGLRNWGEFYVNGKLVAVAVNSPNLGFSNIEPPPYAIVPVKFTSYAPRMLALLEVMGRTKSDLTLPINPYDVRLGHVPEQMPRVFRLYQTGTDNLLAGLSVDPDVTSHPIPVFGCEGKTLLFQADGSGTLRIEVLTQADNWREYDSITVSANKLVAYSMTGEAVLARIYFAPDSPPATITDAEVVVR